MAKTKGSSSSVKVSFGSRRIGKAKKRVGPRQKSVKKYRGQGGRR
jgi:hypothetical protein